ncbi:tetratricopeptide repeat protein [Planctomycetes bacterium K23_9]|uniref:Lipoprotein NlpI n=1 Tax=Stieleria marina TaxID=1930275 RepID=A0A517NMX9_9BACT|nr:lipoprotein NlpI [Planctomycetes bacterium K23_9]
MSESSQLSRPIGISLRKKLFFATLVTFVFFGLVEGLLVLAGVGESTKTSDPFVGFSNQYPLFVPDKSTDPETHVHTASGKLVWFNDQQFARKKPKGVRRIFCVGGSTTFGRPYDDTTSFCGWLREFLPVVDSDTQWEVINAGGVSYASYRVAAVIDELSQYDPDLFIVYSGQNEFLERRTYEDLFKQSSTQRNVTAALGRTRTLSVLKQLVRPVGDEATTPTARPVDTSSAQKQPPITLPGEVDEMLNHTVGPADYHRDAKWHADVLRHYQSNLKRMSAIAKNANAKILFVVPASNEKDCSPFKSELAPDLNDGDQRRFADLLQAASSPNVPDSEKLSRFKATKEIDNQYADVDFQIGQIHFTAESFDEARTAFQAALDGDVCPLRSTSDFQAALRQLSQQQDLMLVDFDAQLRQLCQTEYGHSILGKEYFLDHVHPTIQVHQKLSLWIVECLQQHKWLAQVPVPESEVQRINTAVLAKVDPVAQGVALRNLAKVLHWAGKFSEAEPRARDALRLLPDDPESLLVLADCLHRTDQVNSAVATYDQLLGTAPMYTRAYLPYGELLFELQAYEKAEDIFSVAVLTLPDESSNHVRAQYFLGITYLQLNDFKQAAALLANVDRLFPDDPGTRLFLAQSQAGLGHTALAIQTYKSVLKLSPQDIDALNGLGLLLLNDKQLGEAKECFESALKIDPSNVPAKANLEIVTQLIDKQ